MPEYLTPKDVTKLAPGITEPLLAQLRFRGTGPQFLKPTPRKVLYRRSDVEAWLEASVQTSTARAS
ncbi:hypothetical protein GCM10027282_09960 [Frigoribacterium salinisoli]